MIHSVERFIRRYATALVMLVVTVGFAVTAAVLVDGQNHDADAIAREQEARRTEICTAFDDLQTVSRDLIGVALDGGDGPSPLTSVPSFRDLDPAVQAWVWEFLAEGAADSGNDTTADRLAEFRNERLGPDNLPEFCSG